MAAAALGAIMLAAVGAVAVSGAGSGALAAVSVADVVVLSLILVVLTGIRRRERAQARTETVELMRTIGRHRRVEADLTRIQELMRAGSFLLDADSRTLVCSPAMERITGGFLVHGENTLDALITRVHGDDREFFRAQIERGLAGETVAGPDGSTLNFHFRLVRPSGEIRSIHLRANAERDVRGNVRGLFAFFEDSTEADGDAGALLGDELRAAFEEAAIPTALVGLRGARSGQLVKVNRAFAARLGYPPEDLHGRAFAELGGPEYVARIESNLAALRVAGASSGCYSIHCARPDGELVKFRVHQSCVTDIDDEPLFAVVNLVEAGGERHARRPRFRTRPADAISV
jgi:PAS domain S-box-containing protein